MLNTYLVFDGGCEAAFKFYEKTLGGRIEAILTCEGTPNAQGVPEQWRKKVMHAQLTRREAATRSPRAFPFRSTPENLPKRIGSSPRSLNTDKYHLPIQGTFWAARFGTCVGRFGISRMINCGVASASASR